MTISQYSPETYPLDWFASYGYLANAKPESDWRYFVVDTIFQQILTEDNKWMLLGQMIDRLILRWNIPDHYGDPHDRLVIFVDYATSSILVSTYTDADFNNPVSQQVITKEQFHTTRNNLHTPDAWKKIINDVLGEYHTKMRTPVR